MPETLSSACWVDARPTRRPFMPLASYLPMPPPLDQPLAPGFCRCVTRFRTVAVAPSGASSPASRAQHPPQATDMRMVCSQEVWGRLETRGRQARWGDEFHRSGGLPRPPPALPSLHHLPPTLSHTIAAHPSSRVKSRTSSTVHLTCSARVCQVGGVSVNWSRGELTGAPTPSLHPALLPRYSPAAARTAHTLASHAAFLHPMQFTPLRTRPSPLP